MTQPIPLHWWPESSDLLWDRHESGTLVRRLTSAPAITHNIYCEQPYCSSDGGRLALFRTHDANPMTPGELLVYDIRTYKIARLSCGVSGVGAGIMAIANAAWSGVLFAAVRTETGKRLFRFDLDTLESEDLFPWDAVPGHGVLTVSPDHRFGLSYGLTGRTDAVGRPTFGVYRVDLQHGGAELIHESPDICNPHLQYRLHSGSRVLIQENRGCTVDALGRTTSSHDERGVGLYSIASDGSDRREYPVGPPHTPATTGHECWIGDTDRVLVTLQSVHDAGGRRGNVLEATTTGERARVVFDSPFVWNHISASRCGRYFVADSYEVPGVPLLIGSIASGKVRILCNSLTSGGGPQYGHAHPYFTADSKYVVFNSDRTGVPQVYLASVPEEFLGALEGGT